MHDEPLIAIIFLVFLGFFVTVFVAVGLILAARIVAGRRMRERRAATSGDSSAPVVRSNPPPVALEPAEARDEPQHPEARALFRRAVHARRSAAALYLLGGLAAAGVLVACTPIHPWVSIVRVVLSQVWPVVLTVVPVAVPSFRMKLLVYGTAAALLFLGMWAAGDAGALLEGALLPTGVLALVANRWLKTLAPVAIPSIALTLIAAMVILNWGEGDADWLLVIAATAVLLFLALLVLTVIVIGYRMKILSDLTIQIGFGWAVFSLWYVLGAELVWHLWSAVAAVAAYGLVALSALQLLRRRTLRHPPADLLVLRTFGAPMRTHRLFEEIGTRWRYIGPVQVITGTDSVLANLDLADVAQLVMGRLRKMYVSDPNDLLRRIETLDRKPDADGRYRVNDFFCFEHTWKPTVTELLKRSKTVLLDLSGYGPHHPGVAFELAQLMAQRPLGSFVLMIDETTDIGHLHTTLTRIWRELDEAVPNARLERPVVRILDRPPPRQVMAALCDAAAAGG